MTARQLSTLLAALRLWQIRNLPRVSQKELEAIELISREYGPALDTEEIDVLCAQIARTATSGVDGQEILPNETNNKD